MSEHALPEAPADVLAGVPCGYAVRQMTLADVQEIHALERSLFPADAWPERMFVEELSHPEWRRYWVLTRAEGAEGEAAPALGYAGVQYTPRLADVQTIAVVPEHEGRGLGGFLLELMAERAAAWGASEILLEVRVDNARARGLYAARGYEEIHVRRGYYQDGTDAVIMRRPLMGDGAVPSRLSAATTEKTKEAR